MAARIDFVFFDAGGGHRAAATALESVVAQQGWPWQVRLVNLQELLDASDPFRKLTGIRVQDCYNRLLEMGWTLGSPQLLRALQSAIRVYHPTHVRLLKEFWSQDPPEMIVSLVPNFNRALREGIRQVRPSAPYVTVLTDLADYPPHFWIERQEQWFVCGTEKAAQQALALEIGEERIRRTSGMILRPSFYEPINVDRRAERIRLGLDPDRPTAFVLFGGHGSKAMLEITERLRSSKRELQMILVCGRNDALVNSLRDLHVEFPIYVEGFTSEIPRLMHLSDFFIGKPGPGSVSEALAMNLPVIVQRNRWTLPQERFNADWVRERDVGVVVSSFKEIAKTVDELLEPESFERRKRAVAAIENRAVFEIPQILDSILRGADQR